MTIVVQGAAQRVAQAPRHSEVNQESATRLEPDNQILASTLDGADAFALEFGGDSLRLERPYEPRIVDLDAVESPPDQVWLEHETDRLDLGQLGHLRRSSRARSAAAVEDPRRTRTQRAPQPRPAWPPRPCGRGRRRSPRLPRPRRRASSGSGSRRRG